MRVDQIRRILTRAATEGTLGRWGIEVLEKDILIADYCHIIKVSKEALQLDVEELIRKGMHQKDYNLSLKARDDDTSFCIVGELQSRYVGKGLYELFSSTTGSTMYVRKDLIDEYGKEVEIYGKAPCGRLRIWRMGEGNIGAVMPMNPDKVRGLY